MSIIAPIVTKDTSIIWDINCGIVIASYVYAYIRNTMMTNDDNDNNNNDDTDDDTNQPEWLKFIYKSLDFGSGRERGARN